MLLVLQQVFSTLTPMSTIVVNGKKILRLFCSNILLCSALFSFNDCRDLRCSSTFIVNKAPSLQLAQTLSILPAATAAQVRFLSFWTQVFLNY